MPMTENERTLKKTERAIEREKGKLNTLRDKIVVMRAALEDLRETKRSLKITIREERDEARAEARAQKNAAAGRGKKKTATKRFTAKKS